MGSPLNPEDELVNSFRKANAQIAYFFKVDPDHLSAEEWKEWYQRLKYLMAAKIIGSGINAV